MIISTNILIIEKASPFFINCLKMLRKMCTDFSNSIEVYEKLAEILDKIPNAFPKTEDGTHLELLRKIFSPKEAFITSKLKLRGITIHQLQQSTSLPEEDLQQLLKTLAKKGIIRAWKTSVGENKYAIKPFVVGFYEEQLGMMDHEFAVLYEKYFEKSRMAGLFDTEPPIFKVIPINKTIKTELEIFPYENAENLIQSAKSWAIRDCICKKQQEQLGNNCNYPMTVCINFSPNEHAFDHSELSQAITMQEALNHLKEAEEADLIHCAMNVKNDHYYICNCCTCCCGILRGLTQLHQPQAFVKSNYIVTVNNDECSGCEVCIDRCQFEALSMKDDVCEVNSDKCVGCGVCTIVCPSESLFLVARSKEERHDPPEDMKEWSLKKAKNRRINIMEIL